MFAKKECYKIPLTTLYFLINFRCFMVFIENPNHTNGIELVLRMKLRLNSLVKCQIHSRKVQVKVSTKLQ